MTRGAISPVWVTLAYSAWMAAAGNAALWRKFGALGMFHQPNGVIFAIGMFVLIFSVLVGLLGLFAWRITFKLFTTLLLILTAGSGHFMLTYGVVVDPGMVTNALQTDWHEATALITWEMAGALGVIALLPGWWLWRQPVAYGAVSRQLGRNAGLVLLGLAMSTGATLASFRTLAPVMRNHKEVRYLINPLAPLYSMARVASLPLQRERSGLVAVGEDARLASGQSWRRPPIVLLVLGETARSGNFSINGYARETTPELVREGALSFRNAWSCGTSTAASVPCMFSNRAAARFEDQSGPREGLMDVLQRAGLAVLWIDNQSGCKGVCDRIPHTDTASTHDGSMCPSDECLDGVMLDGLNERIAALDFNRVARGLVIVMHQMGSHGPAYFRRSPAELKRFLPECTSAALNDCSRESLVNAYDNSIVYTDHFLGQAIGWLKKQSAHADTAMIYVSDHGESLGENNLYLHGMPYAIAPAVQKHIPWVTWVSPEFQRSAGLSVGCLRTAQDNRISHDSYFHSVLGLLNVQTHAYDTSLDAYAPCRGRIEKVASARH
jgi:lipid A ethanolaminephosphotransferase